MDEELNTQSQDAISETADVAKNVGGKAKNAAQKVGNGVKQAGKAIGKAAGKTGKAAGKAIIANPLFWKIVLIVAIVLIVVVLFVVIIAAIIEAVTAADYDPDKGTLSSNFGIEGDSFYGARFVYYDEDAASLELQDNYLKLTYNLLNDTKTETGISITLSADYASDQNIIKIATNFAYDLIDDQEVNLPIAQSARLIDHFGFTDEELIIVFESIANTLIENNWTTKNVEEIKSALNNKYQEDFYDEYRNVVPKIYVWDYILDGKNDKLENLPRKDYIGFIFMPKEDVNMKSVAFMFIVDSGYGVEVCLKHQERGQEPTALGDVEIAHSGWYNDKHIQESYDCDVNIELNTFEAIDSNNKEALNTPTSIYKMLGNGSFNNYFIETDDYSGLTLIQNVNTSNYLYLEMNNIDEDRSPFNVAEQMVDYN